jgi:type IV secretory pathway TrbD component
VPSQGSWAVGNGAGHIAQFWFLVGIGAVIGAVAYTLIVYPGTRRPQFRGGPALPRKLGLAAGLAIFLSIDGMAWLANGRQFYAIESAPGVLRLTYRLPTRVVEIPASRLLRVGEELTLRAGGQRHLVLYDGAGARHVGAPMRPAEVARLRAAIESWRGRTRGSSPP